MRSIFVIGYGKCHYLSAGCVECPKVCNLSLCNVPSYNDYTVTEYQGTVPDEVLGLWPITFLERRTLTADINAFKEIDLAARYYIAVMLRFPYAVAGLCPDPARTEPGFCPI